MRALGSLRYGAILIALIFALSHQAQAQNWVSLGGGVPGWAYATCVYNGQLIAGGQFGIMAWNGNSWSPVGGNVAGQVWSLGVYNNQLWAGGDFFTAGTVPVSYIAFWDGTTWNDPEGGTDGRVVALQSWNGLMVAGGYFTTANIPANHIAAWNGTSWSALGSGTGGSQGQVMALSTYNGELIAGGFFTSAGSISANHIAKWNGATWSTLGSGIGGIVYALTNYSGNLIAGGLFSSPGQDVASWNGSSWSALGSGVGGGVYGYCLGLASNGSELCAGGIFTYAGSLSASCIALWNGTSWFSNMNGGMFNGGSTTAVYAVTPYQYGFGAAGIFTSAGGVNSANVAQWVEPATAALDLTITPVNPPIVIPANGGSFQYNMNVHNLTNLPQTFTIKNKILAGNTYYPAFGPVTRTLPGNANPTRTFTQTVASTIPAGINYYISYLGPDPGTVTDSSFFTFTKTAAADGNPWITESFGSVDFLDEYTTSTTLPVQFSLSQNYPNPFNPTTAISYQLQAASHVDLKVYDTAGRLVTTLVDGLRDAGTHEVTFDGSNLTSGVYIYRLEIKSPLTGQVEEYSTSGKMVLMK